MATAQLHNRDAERALLGSCLLGKSDLVVRVRELLPDGAFYTPKHAALWRVICALVDDGVAPDQITVPARARQTERWADPEDTLYVHDLYEQAPLAAGNATWYAAEIARWARIRRVHQAGTRLAQLAEGVAESGSVEARLDDVLAVAQAELGALATDSVGEDKHLGKLRGALLDAAGLDAITEPAPLIDGLIHVDSLIWVQGKPTSGKSFLVLDWAGCVGAGDKWQGYPTRRGEVLYLIAEGVSGIKQRVRAWEHSAGHRMAGVHFLPVAVQSADPAQWTALCRLAGELRPAMTILDTQARVTVGLDENSSQDMGVFVDRIEQLRAAAGGAIVVVHHQGRDGEHLRGSSALDGAAETVIRVKKEDDRITVDCVKQKNGPEFDPITVRLVSYEMSAILSPIEPGASVQIGTPAIRKMISTWWDSDGTDWVSASHLIKNLGIASTTFHKNKKALIKAGLVEEDGTGKTKRYRLTQSAMSPTVPSTVPKAHGTQAIDDGVGPTVPPPRRGGTDGTVPLWPEPGEGSKTSTGSGLVTQHDRPPDVPCEKCGLPLDGFYAAQGHRRHTGCEEQP